RANPTALPRPRCTSANIGRWSRDASRRSSSSIIPADTRESSTPCAGRPSIPRPGRIDSQGLPGVHCPRAFCSPGVHMKLATLFTVGAILAIGFAVPLLLVPGEFLAMYAVESTPGAVLLARLLGAAFTAIGVLSWLARALPEESAG